MKVWDMEGYSVLRSIRTITPLLILYSTILGCLCYTSQCMEHKSYWSQSTERRSNEGTSHVQYHHIVHCNEPLGYSVLFLLERTVGIISLL